MGKSAATTDEPQNRRHSSVVSTTLYDLLGVNSDASQKEICRAFRLRAMKMHPDKRLEEDHEKTKRDFQDLQRAYDILADSERRRQYDETGDEEDCAVDPEAISRISKIFCKVTAEEIECFERAYKGSDEEAQDVAAFYTRMRGNFKDLFEYIPLSQPSEVDHFIAILKNVWKTTRDLSKKQFLANCAALKQQAARFACKAATEKKQLNAAAAANVNSSESLESLALAIRSKQSDRRAQLDTFLDALANKYSGDKKTHRSLEPGKRRKLAGPVNAEQRTASTTEELEKTTLSVREGHKSRGTDNRRSRSRSHR